MRLNITGGIPYQSMQFWEGGICSSSYTLCNTGAACLFAPEGGGAIVPHFPHKIFVSLDSGAGLPGQPATMLHTNIWVDCDAEMADFGFGTSLPDRAFYVLNIKKESCLSFNKGMGFDGIPGDGIPFVIPQGFNTICTYDSSTPMYAIFQLLYIE